MAVLLQNRGPGGSGEAARIAGQVMRAVIADRGGTVTDARARGSGMLGRRYRLDERIASGGMGDVWRGTDEVLGRTVAVKILLPALLDEPGFAERFRGEARTMATINHPGVVDIYDYGSDQQVAYLVMEYVEGDALSRTLSRVGRLTPARTMALVAQAADALQAAHDKGVVHRDVKPGNLLVRPNGTLVLTDFGIARSAGRPAHRGRLGARHRRRTSRRSRPPGQVATAASDIYALGVVAYQCLAGRRPFEGDNPLEIAMQHVREHAAAAARRTSRRRSGRSSSGRWPRTRRPAGPARPRSRRGRPPGRRHWPARPGGERRRRSARRSPPVPSAEDHRVGPCRPPSASVPPAPAGAAAVGPRSVRGAPAGRADEGRAVPGPDTIGAAASTAGPPQNATPYGYARPRTAPQRRRKSSAPDRAGQSCWGCWC